MKNIHTNTFFVKTALVIVITLSFILPTSAVIANTQESVEGTQQALFDAAARPCIIKTLKTYDGSGGIAPLSDGDDIKISPGWYTSGGDDTRPSVIIDQNGNYVITWTNYNADTGYNIGISYAATPTDEQAWQEHGVIFESLTGDAGEIKDLASPDIAFIQGPETTDFQGIYGVFLGLDTDQTGGFTIPDITADPQSEEYASFFTWTGTGTSEVEYCAVADGGFYYQPNPMFTLYNGPVNLYIYHFQDLGYDIPACPLYTNYNIRQTGDGQSVFSFDAQTHLKTAPASDPDILCLNNERFHVTWQYHNETAGKDQIVWKKVVTDGSNMNASDIEYTPYQAYIADGTHPAISGKNDGKIAIAYVSADGNVSCAYSSNDGQNWATSVIGPGAYPDIYAYKDKMYVAYINKGNLSLINSTTGGASWGTPTRINDVDGTVVAEENGVDLHEGGLTWVDSRNADKDIYYQVIFPPEPKPKLELQIKTGIGIGVTAVIKNNGTGAATNVKWNMKITGGIMGGINESPNGTIPSLAAGANQTINSGMFFGLGGISIIAKVTCDEGSSAQDNADGIQIFILTKVK